MPSLMDLQAIVRKGGSVSVDSQSFSAVELAWLARVAGDGKGKLTILNAQALKKYEKGWIVRDAKGSVTFE